MTDQIKDLEGPIWQPATGNPPKQLVIMLHGYGADGQDLISLAPYFSEFLPNAYFVSPNAPHPCEMAPMGYQWFSIQDRDPHRMVADARQVSPILHAYYDKQLDMLNLTDKDLIIMGFSQGAMLAIYTGLRRQNSCAGIIGFSGMLIADDKMTSEVTSRPPTLLMHGDQDQVVPSESLAIAEQGLKDNKVPVEAVMVPGLGHGIDQSQIIKAGNFMQTCCIESFESA